jgi:hypothetical protein
MPAARGNALTNHPDMNVEPFKNPKEANGRCACGLIRFAVMLERRVGVCRCEVCRRTSGLPFQGWVNARRDSLRVYGLPAQWRSSEHASRQFCAACGSSLFLFEDSQTPLVEVALTAIDDQKLIDRIEQTFVHSAEPRRFGRVKAGPAGFGEQSTGAPQDSRHRGKAPDLACEILSLRA